MDHDVAREEDKVKLFTRNGLDTPVSDTMSKQPTVFVTGGGGYVGSHTVLELLNEGYNVIVVDNFVNAVKGTTSDNKPECLQRVERLADKTVTFYEADLQNKSALKSIFILHNVDCVIHFAALKAVGESVEIPLQYYKNNVGGTITLLEVMKEVGVKKIIFSSSATVYGQPQYLPIDEKHPVGQTCTNPYGRTKYFVEEILKDVCKAEEGWNVMLLRYFNPVGAHESGLFGEDPNGTPNNLMPFIAQVAVGRRPEVKVFGGDYDTKDGTGVRDYIHVVDLAVGHVAALRKIMSNKMTGCKVSAMIPEWPKASTRGFDGDLSGSNVFALNFTFLTGMRPQQRFDTVKIKVACGSKHTGVLQGGVQAYNLGTGQGYSVLEVLEAFSSAAGKQVPYTIVDRRPGDVASVYADPSLATEELGWSAHRTLLEMCADTWRWQSMNPNGYAAPRRRDSAF